MPFFCCQIVRLLALPSLISVEQPLMSQDRNGAIALFLVALGPLLISCSDLLARGDGGASLKDASLKSLEVYTFRRPPFSDSGTYDSSGRYFEFTNARGAPCAFRLKSGCYLDTGIKVKNISPGIIKVGDRYACSHSIIPNMINVQGYSYGYGVCTHEGWVPEIDP
mgnify:CR=1 FL=1